MPRKQTTQLTLKEIEKLLDRQTAAIVSALDPYFAAIQKDFDVVSTRFDKVDMRFDKIEKLILADYKRRIEKLEIEVKDVLDLLAIR